jgi:hypothetical protein
MNETANTNAEHRNRLQRAFQLAIHEAWSAGNENVSVERVRHFLRGVEFEDRATETCSNPGSTR